MEIHFFFFSAILSSLFSLFWFLLPFFSRPLATGFARVTKKNQKQHRPKRKRKLKSFYWIIHRRAEINKSHTRDEYFVTIAQLFFSRDFSFFSPFASSLGSSQGPHSTASLLRRRMFVPKICCRAALFCCPICDRPQLHLVILREMKAHPPPNSLDSVAAPTMHKRFSILYFRFERRQYPSRNGKPGERERNTGRIYCVYVYNLAGYLDGDICMSKKTNYTYLGFDINILRLCSSLADKQQQQKKKARVFFFKTKPSVFNFNWMEEAFSIIRTQAACAFANRSRIDRRWLECENSNFSIFHTDMHDILLLLLSSELRNLQISFIKSSFASSIHTHQVQSTVH